MDSVLLVDDEADILEVLEIVLRGEGLDVARATTGRAALAHLKEAPTDIVISDIRMPDISGVELLKQAQGFAPDATFIMMTAYASTDTAVEALQHGAYDYLNKPFNMDDIRATVRGALEAKHRKPAAAAREESRPQQGQRLFQALHRNRLVGRSPQMLEVYRTIGRVAAGDSTVLLTGESGTGKELVARAIHTASRRTTRPFVSINCGAFPETLLESELFGYARGAFTGATTNRAGLFEAAHQGTIFLDEIGEMSSAMQVKLLRVLQDRRLRPLGTSTEVPVDVRVIAATNRDLRASMQQGQFREDLYYRVAVIAVHLPPLRERAGDIGLLAQHFLLQICARTGKKISAISPDALARLEQHAWPGNVRELENTLERAIALEQSGTISPESLPETVRGNSPACAPTVIAGTQEPYDLEKRLADIERNLICEALRVTGGNQTAAAQFLSLTKPSLRHKIHVLGIDAGRFRGDPVA